MTYRVLLQRSAQKSLEKIPSEVRNRIYSALKALAHFRDGGSGVW